MCGIAGIFSHSLSIQERKEQMHQMLEIQKHRGPDAQQHWHNESCSLGHNRLSIIDLSENANQPMQSSCGRYVIVFNGEIYNYLEIKKELQRNFVFQTQSDTEVLLYAFIHWGKDFLHRLNGMFAFAIWDGQEKQLFAARDRFGVKPFYYSWVDEALYFASEIKALHAAGIPKAANEQVWSSYFAYGSYGMPEETFWESILQLPGGHYLEFQNNKLIIEKWYFFEDEVAKQPKNLSFDQAKQHYLGLLKDSIKLRFRADVPIGFNISGGLDSSVLLALVNLQENFVFNTDAAVTPSGARGGINAYTFYTNNADYDELPWVEKMISRTKNPLSKVLLKADEVPVLSQKMAWQQDEPFGGIPTLAYAKIFEQARKDKVLVLLDGQGMDEQWAGYDYYTQDNEATIQGVQDSPFKVNMLSNDFLAKAVKPKYPKPFDDEVLNKQYRDLFYTKIPRALRFNDRISMAFSTELREPFLDYRLVEFAFSLPLEYKIKWGQTKYMLREIAAEHLSKELVFAPKRALQTPQREWLADELKEWVGKCINELSNSSHNHWFDKEIVDKELKAYWKGNIQSSFHIWQLISCALLTNKSFS